MSYEFFHSDNPYLAAVFVFFITLLVGGAFFFAIWYDLRTRLWFQHSDRDTGTAIAEIISRRDEADESIEGSTVVTYRFEDASGKSHEGSARFPRSCTPLSMNEGNKIKIYYYTKFPGWFSYANGCEQHFKSSSRFIGFFIFCAIFMWWFMS